MKDAKVGRSAGEIMTCREFDTVVAELVRHPNAASSAESGLDASVRSAGEGHVAECASCAGRWIAEERLSASLQALAVSSETKASDAVEGRLLEAFRARQLQAKSSVAAAETKVVPFRKTATRTPWMWAGAIAAAVALIALLVSVRSGSNGPEGTIAKQTPVVVTPKESPQVAAVTPSREPEAPQRTIPVRRVTPKRQTSEPRMVATEFVPMERGGFIEPMDRGQLVRMQVPRMAMRNAGFPVREDRLSEPVLADVLVGEDGTARGIRFVKFTQ